MTHILIVEDSDVDFAALQRSLLKAIPNVTISHDVYGIEAIEKLLHDQLKPNLIISDQNLPQTSGVELCLALREADIHTPIIIMTGGGSEEIAVEALKSGASDYVVKDVSGSWANLLAEMIPTVLQRAEDKIMRKKAEDELRKTAEELQLRNQELNAFARTVAHDLKSPVAQMIGFAELLREASPTILENKKDEWISNIVRIGEKSAETIQALLDLARYENEEAEFHSFDMWFTFEAVVFKLHNSRNDKKQSIKFPKDWPYVMGNPNWMSEVWFSLIGNAIQSGGEPLKVEVSWERTPDSRVRFSIENNGRKLSQPEQESFFQLSGPTTLKRDIGLSLGVSIAKKLIEKQGGVIGIESPNEVGSTVWFTLPEAIHS